MVTAYEPDTHVVDPLESQPDPVVHVTGDLRSWLRWEPAAEIGREPRTLATHGSIDILVWWLDGADRLWRSVVESDGQYMRVIAGALPDEQTEHELVRLLAYDIEMHGRDPGLARHRRQHYVTCALERAIRQYETELALRRMPGMVERLEAQRDARGLG